jgi:hypothetical protein
MTPLGKEEDCVYLKRYLTNKNNPINSTKSFKKIEQ